MSNFLAWAKGKLPKIYLINSSQYPKFEYPVGSGVMHEYPHYVFAGKKIPTGHVAVGCLLGFYAIFQLYSLSSSGGKSKKDHKHQEVKFPEPIRHFDKEKEEFVKAFLEAEGAKAHH